MTEKEITLGPKETPSPEERILRAAEGVEEDTRIRRSLRRDDMHKEIKNALRRGFSELRDELREELRNGEIEEGSQ